MHNPIEQSSETTLKGPLSHNLEDKSNNVVSWPNVIPLGTRHVVGPVSPDLTADVTVAKAPSESLFVEDASSRSESSQETDHQEEGLVLSGCIWSLNRLYKRPSSPSNSDKSCLSISIRLANERRVRALIDSGASANFISDAMVASLRSAKVQANSAHTVELGNGSREKLNGCVELLVDYNGKKWLTCFWVLPKCSSQEVILGNEWLMVANPTIDWQTQIVSTQMGEDGVICVDSNRSTKKLLNSLQRQDPREQWFRIKLQSSPNSNDMVQCSDPEIRQLVEEYADVFPAELPKKLPP